MKKILVIFLCLCDLIVYSQTSSVIEVQQIRIIALEIFKSYADKMETLNSYSDKDEFSKLFDSETQIYNDILYDNQPQTVTPKEYLSKTQKNVFLSSKITNWELGYPYKYGDKWNVIVKFEKEIKIKFDSCSNVEYPSKNFKCEMKIVMDKNINYNENSDVEVDVYDVEERIPFINAKISSLTVENPINFYCIVKINDISLLKPKYKDTKDTIKVNLPQFVELEQKTTDIKKELFLNNYNEDYRISEIIDNCNAKFYDFKVIPLKKIIGLNLSYTPLQFSIVNKKMSNLNMQSFNAGLSLVFKRLISKNTYKNKLYFILNPGYSFDVFNFNGEHFINYKSIDSDNDQYLRKIKLSNISEKDIFHNFDIPLGLGLINTNKWFTLTMDLGAWVNYSFLKTHKSTLNAFYSGFYEQYCNVEISENGYYDFGKYSLSKKEKEVFVFNLKNLDYGAFCSIGAMFKLKNYYYLASNVEYRYGIADRSTYNENFILQFTKDKYSPFFSTISSWATNKIIVNFSILKKF